MMWGQFANNCNGNRNERAFREGYGYKNQLDSPSWHSYFKRISYDHPMVSSAEWTSYRLTANREAWHGYYERFQCPWEHTLSHAIVIQQHQVHCRPCLQRAPLGDHAQAGPLHPPTTPPRSLQRYLPQSSRDHWYWTATHLRRNGTTSTGLQQLALSSFWSTDCRHRLPPSGSATVGCTRQWRL